MQIINTSSKQCKIIIQGDKKYVLRYPREIGKTVEYYRSTPENEVIRVLEGSEIKTPKILHSGKDYSIQEYIPGQLLSDIFQDHKNIDKNIIRQIIEQICALTKINGESLAQYTNWSDSRSFYDFQCNNTQKVFLRYYNMLKPIYEKLGISPNTILPLFDDASKIDANRKLSIIHGDRHKKNAILTDSGEVVFIDWELGCLGDVAYDIGFHLHQMAYTEEDEQYFIEGIANNFGKDAPSILNDVKVYRRFLLARSMLYHVYWTDLVYQGKNKQDMKNQLGHFMRRYNRLSKYGCFGLKPKTEEDLNFIFEEYRKDVEDFDM